jgi:NAD(P)-dependent dehydrogenase (short-subunit alcohol dehydrogenase family)
MTSMTIDLSGQTALVTGGATGLGFAIAAELGTAGARIGLNDLTRERVDAACDRLAAAGVECAGFAADVRDRPAIEEMVQGIEERWGAPDIVVANAGIYPNTPFLEMTEEEWDRVFDINVKGTFLTCQAAARSMAAARVESGRIVVLSSGAANAAIRGWSHYCASKAAVAMLARAMALELAEHGIRVNAVLPGYIDVDEGGSHLDESYKSAARAAIPIGRPGTPEDIARAILLLVSPLAGYITGTSLVVDGGSSTGRPNLRPITRK